MTEVLDAAKSGVNAPAFTLASKVCYRDSLSLRLQAGMRASGTLS